MVDETAVVYRKGIWIYNPNSKFGYFPAIESLNPNESILLYCGFASFYDIFGFDINQFKPNSVSFDRDRLTLETSDINICLNNILKEVPRTKLFSITLRDELSNVKNLQLILRKELGDNYRRRK